MTCRVRLLRNAGWLCLQAKSVTDYTGHSSVSIHWRGFIHQVEAKKVIVIYQTLVGAHCDTMARRIGGSILGWPHDFYKNTQRGATCDICCSPAKPIAIHRDCPMRHNTCPVCFYKHSYSEDKMIYECPRCIYERMMAVKKNWEKWLDDRCFVHSPDIATGAYRYSPEAAKRKALREGKLSAKDSSTSASRDMDPPAKSSSDVATVSVRADSGGGTSSNSLAAVSKRSSQRGSRGDTLKLTIDGTEREYMRVKEVNDCDECRAALCMDCIWEVVTPTQGKH